MSPSLLMQPLHAFSRFRAYKIFDHQNFKRMQARRPFVELNRIRCRTQNDNENGMKTNLP